ncbi:MAG: DUF3791 domain-containing protein [Selenomonas sp.]|nr:DUF3791 domain-containing protein [Selenomonadales bacterium]MDY5716631.1 DUF3791 domain-containing protein [Selenomonas sp.]
MDSVIKNTNELEFAIFCIENLAKRFHTDGKMMYNLLAEQSDILNDYIVPEYEVLHTQDKEYILDELAEIMAERGVKI